MQAFDAQYQKLDITTSFGTVDPLARTGSQMYYGSGNSTTNFHITQNDTLDFQLDLKEKVRSGPDIAPTSTDPDGTAHFTAPAGMQSPTRAAWSFDFAVVTGLDGSKHDLGDFDFKMVITQNGTNTHTFDLNAATHEWIDESNPLIRFSGDDFNQPATANVQAHVAENSANLGFGPMQLAFGPLATSTAVGTTYDIKLEAFDHTHLVGMVHDYILLA
jgi:hypothetical protein